jgi:hypothetical protein
MHGSCSCIFRDTSSGGGRAIFGFRRYRDMALAPVILHPDGAEAKTKLVTGTPSEEEVESPSFSRYRDGTTSRIGGGATSCVRGRRDRGGVTSSSRRNNY